MIKSRDRERRADILHHDIGSRQTLHHVAASALRLDADSNVRPLKYAVAHHHVAHAARHLAADSHAAVPLQHDAVGDRDVLIRLAHLAAQLR